MWKLFLVSYKSGGIPQLDACEELGAERDVLHFLCKCPDLEVRLCIESIFPVPQAEVNPNILRDDAGQARWRRAEECLDSDYHEERPSGKQD